jgi:hypothetical protein
MDQRTCYQVTQIALCMGMFTERTLLNQCKRMCRGNIELVDVQDTIKSMIRSGMLIRTVGGYIVARR